jgi:mannitol-1-phosphate 5-dehydrogenase
MVMACENAINATDLLVNELRDLVSEPEWTTLLAKGVFANTAVDRIVPTQRPGDGLDVTVETYFEWVVEHPVFGGHTPSIPHVTWVTDLEPYIERKLFTVNTGHAAICSERLIGPAAELAERGVRPQHLLATVEAALSFPIPGDAESVKLQRLLATLPAAEATERITGLGPAHPLYPDVHAVVARVAAHQR